MKRIFTLFAAALVAATTWAALEEVTPAADALDGLVVVATDVEGDAVLASAQWRNHDLQSYSYKDIKEGKGDYCWKLTKVTDVEDVEGNLYTIQIVGKDGSPEEGWWNPSYLQETNDGAFFRLWLGDQYGADAKYNGLWSISYEEGKGYVVYNVGKGNYLTTKDFQATAEKTYIHLFSFEDTTIPVGIQFAPSTVAQGKTFDLTGKAVVNAKRGIIIKDGKKYFVK